MAFFASFVQGVFQGMDWREGREDRARRRDIQDELMERDRERFGWEQEDRTHTRSERAHSLSERQRALAEREADLAAWDETTDQMLDRDERRSRSREISIMPPERVASVPRNTTNSEGAGNVRPTPDATQVASPETAQRSLGVTGSSTGETAPRPVVDSSKRGGVRADQPVPEMLLNDGTFMGFANNAGARPDEYWRGLNESQRRQFVERAAAPQSVRGPLQGVIELGADTTTAANPSYREPNDERPEAWGRPGRTIGLPLDDVVLPPELPQRSQGGRVRHQPQPGSTASDPLERVTTPPPQQQRRPVYAAADWEPTPLSTQGEPLREVRLPGDQPPPPDEARQRADQLAGAVPGFASRVAEGARGLGRRVSEDLAYSRDVGGAVLERGLGTGLSVLGAPEAGAQAFRREQAATDRVQQNEQQREARRGIRPDGAEPSAGTSEVGQKGVQQGSSQQEAPTTAQGTPITSLDAVQRQAPRQQAGASSGNGNSRQPSAAQRDQAADRAVQEYRTRRMAPIVERYLRTGRPDQARAFEVWMNERGVQEGMRSWARAIHAYNTNDFEGMLDGLVGAYEANDYYDDGLSVDRRQTEVQRDARGNITGATITFRDNATGRTFQQEITGIRDLAAVAIGTLSPEAVFERMWEQTFGTNTSEQERERQRAYGQAYERLSRADFNWSALSQEEQHQRIMDHLQRGSGASGIGAGPVPVYSD